jgi:hypothetical protein
MVAQADQVNASDCNRRKYLKAVLDWRAAFPFGLRSKKVGEQVFT